MDAPGRLAGRAETLGGVRMHRRMRTAGELRFRCAGLAQNASGRVHMKRLGVVRGGADRDLRGGQPEPFDAAVFHQRQRLKHLDG